MKHTGEIRRTGRHRRRFETSASATTILVIVAVLLLLGQLVAAAEDSPCSEPPATTTVVAEARYQLGAFGRFLLGKDYRQVWAIPIEVEVLNLACEAGGLVPVRQVGQLQTPGLSMRGADGRSYTFRGVNKDPTRVLEKELRDTTVAKAYWDQISASFPGGSVAAAPIVRAAGVLQSEPRLVVMPDDPRLGEFRETFAGLLGTIEEFPTAGSLGTTEILTRDTIYERVTASFDDRIDDRAFLRARLVDLLIGDWDRHVGQWRWAKLPGNNEWQPLPEDRDWALSRFDGFLMQLRRDRRPRFSVFGPDYAPLEGLAWSARSLDRRFLSNLERSDFREIALELQGTLSDAVIEAALRRLPPEYFAAKGPDLLDWMRRRRDALDVEAEKFYEFLAAQVNVYGSNEAELIVIDRTPEGDVEITITEAAPGGDSSCKPGVTASSPVFQRHFLAGETRSIRLYTGAGDDRVIFRGASSSAIGLKVVGGSGQNLFCDEPGGRMIAFDLSTVDEPGRGEKIDRGVWIAPSEPLEKNSIPEYGQQGESLKSRRDWGKTSYGQPWFGVGPDLGVFMGYERIFETFAFRKRPYATQNRIGAGFSFRRQRPKFVYQGTFRAENSRRSWVVRGVASGLENLNFYGFGNETAAFADSGFFEVKSETAVAEASAVFRPTEHTKLGIGPIFRYNRTDVSQRDFISALQPYGVGDFGQAGLRGRLRFNSRAAPDEKDLKFTDDPLRFGPPGTGPGYTLRVDAHYYPRAIDLESGYGLVSFAATGDFELSEARTFLGIGIGGQKNWGKYPYYDAAFIGSTQVRGLPSNRFAGDASLFADVSLRQRLIDLTIFLPGTMGLTLRADVGRVFVDGEESGLWHPSAGVGLWWSPWNEGNTVEIYVAKSDEATRGYLLVGFEF